MEKTAACIVLILTTPKLHLATFYKGVVVKNILIRVKYNVDFLLMQTS